MTEISRAAVELVVLVHFAFVLFVILGGLLVLRWRRLAWFHLPAVVWGVLIEFAGWICPLTPLENWLRRKGGMGEYETGFIEHYILPVLYPDRLTRELQIALGLFALALNLVIYAWIWRRGRRRHRR